MKKAGIILILIIIIIFPVISADSGAIQVNILPSGDCILEFEPGWNFFSFCSELENPDLLEILTPIEGNYLFVMEWDEITKEFKIYSTASSDPLPFNAFDDDKGYFIYITEENVNLNLLDPNHLESPAGETRDLIQGWNTPSYPYRNSISVLSLISAIQEDISFIMKWNNVNKLFDIYSFASTDTPPFTTIQNSEGMFIYNTNENMRQITYP